MVHPGRGPEPMGAPANIAALDLNDLFYKRARSNSLNAARDDGWELGLITRNGIAFFKRQIDDDPAHGPQTSTPPLRAGVAIRWLGSDSRRRRSMSSRPCGRSQWLDT
jgi:hypothetical protein